MRILIAEDDFTSRSILAAVLKKAGYEVIETVNGTEAWQALQHPTPPKLVILDWIMPEMNGLEVISRVRAIETDQPPYIIMLTTKYEKTDIIAGLNAGANDYLSKPFDVGELYARVEVGRRMIEMQAELIKSRDMLAYHATHDPMTGMLNRRAILNRMNEEISRADRHGDILSVGICDIDHFKQINDLYGHQTGDDVLSGLSKIMKENLRQYDSVGRIGGEEFLLIAPIKVGTDCSSLFSRLRGGIANTKMLTRSGVLSITVSIGVAFSASGITVDEILATADAALYRAKEQGRNRIVYATDSRKE